MNEKFKSICMNSETFGPISNVNIEIAEKELGVFFSKEYREFLLEFGALLGDGFEIYGLPDKSLDEPTIWQNVVTVTKQLRSYNQIGSENLKMIPIASNGMGTNYFLNTENSETEIWEVSHDLRRIVAVNLYDLIKILRNE